MSTISRIDRYLTRFPRVSALVYVAFVSALFLTTLFTLIHVGDRYGAVSASAEILAQLERRALLSSSETNRSDSVLTGSPFLEGQTVTVAGAALLQRITRAVTRVGGSVQSSEVETRDAQSRNGYVRVSVTCEFEESALQQLLYDIEVAMPLLFVDQLVAQAPVNESGRMRVLLAVSGMWAGAK